MDKAPEHKFEGNPEICKRCGFTKNQLIKKIDTTMIVDAVLANSSFEDIRDLTIKEINRQTPCLTDDEVMVKDIIL